MKRIWKKLGIILSLLLVAIGLAGCGNKAVNKSNVYQHVKKTNTIIWGVRNDTPLFGLVDPKSGTLRGFEIDLAKALTKEILGPTGKCKLFQVSAKTKIPVLKNGNIDVLLATCTITPDRAKVVDFSKPYFGAGQSLLVPKTSSLHSIKQLNKPGTKVLAVKGTTAIANIQKVAPKAKLLEYDDYGQCFSALKSGQGVAMSTDNGILAGIAANNPQYHVVGGSFTTEPYGIAVDKGQHQMRDEINKAFAKLKANGTYDRLLKKWFADVPGFNYKEVEK
ncbi:MAG: transporter substrate-binding domain-containing protein [Lactobacillus sp.]|jgi:putative glutamine transport system substrate-binding protein|nr:transporter substrate-binding domain-containing protein [Lactobacillus sp.]